MVHIKIHMRENENYTSNTGSSIILNLITAAYMNKVSEKKKKMNWAATHLGVLWETSLLLISLQYSSRITYIYCRNNSEWWWILYMKSSWIQLRLDSSKSWSNIGPKNSLWTILQDDYSRFFFFVSSNPSGLSKRRISTYLQNMLE